MSNKYYLLILISCISTITSNDGKNKKRQLETEVENSNNFKKQKVKASNSESEEQEYDEAYMTQILNMQPMDYAWMMYGKADKNYRMYKLYYGLKTLLYLFTTMGMLKMTATTSIKSENADADMNIIDKMNIRLYILTALAIIFGPLLVGAMESWCFNNISSISEDMTNAIQKELIQAAFNKKIAFYTAFSPKDLKKGISEIPKLVKELVALKGDSMADEWALYGCLACKTLMSCAKGLECLITRVNNDNKPACELIHSINAHHFLIYMMITGVSMAYYYYRKHAIITPARKTIQALRLGVEEDLEDAVSNASLINTMGNNKAEVDKQIKAWTYINRKQREYEYKDSLKYLIPLPTLLFTCVRSFWAFFRTIDENKRFNLLPWNNSKPRNFDFKKDLGLKKELDNIFDEITIAGYLASTAVGIVKRQEEEKMKLLELEYYMKTLYSCTSTPDTKNVLHAQDPNKQQGTVELKLNDGFTHPHDPQEEMLHEFRANFAHRQNNLDKNAPKKANTGIHELDVMIEHPQKEKIEKPQ